MSRGVTVGLLCALLGVMSTAIAQAGPDDRVAPGAWVDIAPLPEPKAPRPEGETHYLLVDHQVRVANGSQHYHRFVQRLRNAQQVEDASQISIEFRPGLEQVAVHEVSVWRNGARVDQWPAARRTLLHREQELERGIVDDARTLSLILSDVRVGDTLDYSYTLSRNHRLTDGRYSGRFRSAWNAGIEHQRVRLLHTAERRLRYAPLNETQAPRIRPWGDAGTELQWDWYGLKPSLPPDDEPAWYTSLPFVQFSEFADWNEVARWAVPFYATPAKLSPALEAWRAQIVQLESPAERVIAALRFVQDEIRYTGISVGEGAYVPSAPEVVLARRYGDCKDKVLLLITVLRAVGIEADAALVNLNWPVGKDTRLPSPAAFDHVIARVRVAGQTHWLDPTIASQGGTLAALAPLNYGAALVIRPDSRELEPLPVATPTQAWVETRESYDLRRGKDHAAVLSVTTRYRGGEADTMRRRLQRESSADLTKSYLDFYAQRFADLTARAPVSWTDDREQNLITLVESYELPQHFIAEGARESMEIVAYGIEDSLPDAPEASRNQPLGLQFPLHLHHETEVLFHDDWPIEAQTAVIDAPGFKFAMQRSYANRRLQLTHEFRTTQDHVAAPDLQLFRDKLDAVSGELTFVLSQPSGDTWPTRGDISYLYVGGALLCFVLGGFIARWLWTRIPPPVAPAPSGSREGLAGWMILVVVGVIAGPVFTIVGIRETLPFVSSSVFADAGSGLATEARALGLRGLLLLWIALAWVRLPVDFATVGLMLARRRGFPLAWLWSTWSAVLFALVSVLIVLMISTDDQEDVIETSVEFLGSLISSAIWTVYILVSKRVRATFVRDARRAVPAAPAAATATLTPS
jgi:transglutaminase-like putative cysteine protease